MGTSTLAGFDLLGVDAITIEVAVGATLAVYLIRRRRKVAVKDMRGQIIIDLLNGSVIYPFVILFASVFRTNDVISYQGSKFSIGLASMVGLVFVIGELARSCTKVAADHNTTGAADPS